MVISQSDLDDIQKVLVVDSAGNYSTAHVRGDEFGSVRVVDNEHEAVHAGKMFTHSNIHLGVAVNSYVDHVFAVSSSAEPHMRVGKVAADGGPFWIELYKDVQVSSLGAATPVFNNNRNFPDTNGMTVHEASVVTSTGGSIFEAILSGTNQLGSSEDYNDIGWILKSGSKYLLRIWNKAAQAKDVSLTQKWYEQ